MIEYNINTMVYWCYKGVSLMNEYVLMNKNKPVVAFKYDSENHKVVKIVEKYDLRYAPPGALDNKGDVNKRTLDEWWHDRAIPASRDQINRMMESLHLRSTLVLAERSFGLSLSDRYWINNPKESLKWEDINFFDNDFSEDLGFLTLGQQSSKRRLDLMSPNSTLGGDLKKKWTIINGQRTLLKSGLGIINQEVYNEVIATHLYQRLLNDDEYVPYTLIRQGNSVFSACPNMLKEDEELIPAYDIIQNRKKLNSQNDYQFLVESFENLGLKNVEESLCKMFTCDYILANRDRHWRNFGVIRNVETLEYTRIAPIFDSGSCLWCDVQILNYPTDYRYIAKPFGKNGMQPDKQLELFKDYKWLDLTKLEGFDREVIEILSQNENIPEKRLSKIKQGIEDNIAFLVEHVKKHEQPSRLHEVAKEAIKVNHELSKTGQINKDNNKDRLR